LQLPLVLPQLPLVLPLPQLLQLLAPLPLPPPLALPLDRSPHPPWPPPPSAARSALERPLSPLAAIALIPDRPAARCIGLHSRGGGSLHKTRLLF